MRIELGASVGFGGVNNGQDVRSVQQRLNDLGYSWVSADGVIGPITISAIRLFQSIVYGRQTVGGDGRVDPGMTTHRWLQADNAPAWMEMPLKGPGFVNVERQDVADKHDFGTSWLADAVAGSGVLYEENYRAAHNASPIAVNDASWPRGGDSPDHAGHETGLSIDMRLPVTGGGTPAGRTFRSSDYDRDAMRMQLRSFHDHGLVRRVFFNDPILVNEGLCKAIAGHDNHIHLEIEPPARVDGR